MDSHQQAAISYRISALAKGGLLAWRRIVPQQQDGCTQSQGRRCFATSKSQTKVMRVVLKSNVHGEDDPIFSERLDRDGWRLMQELKVDNRGYPHLFLTVQPEIRMKPLPGTSQFIRLTRSIQGLKSSEEFALIDDRRSVSVSLDGASWADWDQQGRLVLAAGGKILAGSLDGNGNLVQQELFNLNPSKPTSISTPTWAASW
jgi:hypothetical protein